MGLWVWLVACERPSPTTSVIPLSTPAPPATLAAPTPTLSPTQSPTATLLFTPATLLPTVSPTPYFSGIPSTPCGQQLPILPASAPPPLTNLAPDPAALATLRAMMPESAVPALNYLLEKPHNVGLALYRMGDEANGVYLNADVPMPLASVVKVIHLVAYVEGVAAGTINPLTAVSLDTLTQYHIPNFDLGAHRRAVQELEENGRIFGNPPAVTLDDVVWMMTRHSSNAATDYLHRLLGQETIEQTAVSLGLTSQTAPCPFLGQFLAMANHTRGAASDRNAILAYLDDPAAYSREVTLLVDAFLASDSFRQSETAWRREQERPSFSTQQLFSNSLNPQATPRDYATLMARIAQNGLSNPESSFQARRFLEWPMIFPNNQALFSNLGYKNGTLPGILTTVYYAYPLGEVTPLVIALFYHDLPRSTYQTWRSTLPHDELARWLLADPAALPALRAVLKNGE